MIGEFLRQYPGESLILVAGVAWLLARPEMPWNRLRAREERDLAERMLAGKTEPEIFFSGPGEERALRVLADVWVERAALDAAVEAYARARRGDGPVASNRLAAWERAAAEGVPAPDGLDVGLFHMVVEELESFRRGRGLTWTPERFARIAVAGYAMMKAEENKTATDTR